MPNPTSAAKAMDHRNVLTTPFILMRMPSDAIPVVAFTKLRSDAIIPRKATPSAVGFDLYSCETYSIGPWSSGLIPTGITSVPPLGCYLRITGRSGLSLTGFQVQNGTVDIDYTGELKVIMFNATDDMKTFEKGMRIAQIIPETFAVNAIAVEKIEARPDMGFLSRGDRGFGSSGLF